jgi:molybdate transport system substrate-binding protein
MIRRNLLAVAAIACFSPAIFAQSAELHVLASRGVQSTIEELKPQCERAIGHKLAIDFNSTTGLKEKIAKGDPFDVVILTSDAIDEFVKSGKISPPTRADLARCGVGVGVKAGAAKPDISTAEAFKKTLLNVKSVTWAEDGASRQYIMKMMDALGITAAMQPKIVLEQGSVKAAARVADGRTDMVLTLVSEIMPAPGVDLVGPFPEKVQNYVNFAIGVSANTTQANAAKAMIKFYKTPEAAKVFKAKGMEAR